MRRAGFIAPLLAVILPLTVLDCTGQKPCPATNYGSIVSQQSQTAGPHTALNLSDPASGIAITSGPDAFTAPVLVELTVYSQPVPLAAFQPQGADQQVSPQAVVLQLSQNKLADQQTIQITMPTPGALTANQAVIALTINGQQIVVLPTTASNPAAGTITATLSGGVLEPLIEPLGNCPLRITLFATSADIAPRQFFTPQLFVYNPGSDPNGPAFTPIGPTNTMQGKRVALLVHGLTGDPEDFRVLAPWLLTNFQINQNGTARPYYDEVWAYGYNSNAPLELIGTSLATMAGPFMRPARTVDLFGHSMGVLACRYAMETTTLGANRLGTPTVRNFVSLAGVNEGLPVGRLQAQIWALLPDLKPDEESTEEMFTDYIPLPGQWSTAGANSFLAALNQGQGPDYASARYYAAGGTNSNISGGPGANPLTQILTAENAGRNNDVRYDGVVCVYSSLGLDGVLAQKSAFFASQADQGTAVTALFNLDHLQMVGLDDTGADVVAMQPGAANYDDFQALLQQLQTWIDSWIAGDGLSVLGR